MCRKDEDRLSSLPNDVLIIILSYLPTISAISTSVLSRSWRYLWTQVTSLRFTTSDFLTFMFTYCQLVNLLDLVIGLSHTLGCGPYPWNLTDPCFHDIFRHIPRQKINSAELIVAASTSKYFVHRLVDIAATLFIVPNVKEFKLKSEIYGDLIHVPLCIFEKRSLEALEMDGFPMTKLESNQILPKLKKLVINVDNFDLERLENVLNSCPVLENLRVAVHTERRWSRLTHPIVIKSRSLKRVSLNLVGTYEAFNEGMKEVMIDAPKLEYLEVDSPVILRFCFLKTPNELSRAKLSMGGDASSTYPSRSRLDTNDRIMIFKPNEFSRAKLSMGGCESSTNHLLMLFNQIFQVKTLSICGHNLIRALGRIDIENLELSRKLTHVDIIFGSGGGFDDGIIIGVRKFLSGCPNLKRFALSKNRGKLYWVKSWVQFLLGVNLYEGTNFCVSKWSQGTDMKVVGDFDRVKKDDKIMVEITIHVYQNDQSIYNAKRFVLSNQPWDSKYHPRYLFDFCI